MNLRDKTQPRIFVGTGDPNELAIEPEKVGDIYVRVHDTAGSAGLYFCKSITYTGSKWGTAGTG